jgi:hypothetical protein
MCPAIRIVGLVRVQAGADDDAARPDQRVQCRQEAGGRGRRAEQPEVVAEQQRAVEGPRHPVGRRLLDRAGVHVEYAALAAGQDRARRNVERDHVVIALLQDQAGAAGAGAYVQDPTADAIKGPLIPLVLPGQVVESVEADESVVPLDDDRIRRSG